MLDYQRFKEINDLFAQGRSEEARRLLMEMQSRYIALRDEMNILKQQVREFEDILFLSKCLHFDHQFYWIKIASVKQGPFCPDCYDRDGTLIRLASRRDTLYCPYCGTEHERIAHAVGEEIPAPNPRQARVIPFAR